MLTSCLSLFSTCSPRQNSNTGTALIGLLNGGTGSSVTPNQVSTPQFSQVGGTYSASKNIAISTVTSGASIFYTTDGTEPATIAGGSTYAYSGAINADWFGQTKTIKAIAMKSGMENSTVASASYSFVNSDSTSSTQNFSFDRSMQTSITPVLLAEAYDGSGWVTVPTVGSVLNWSNSTSLTVSLSWVRLPENTRIRFTVSNLQDVDGQPVPDQSQIVATGIHRTHFPLVDTGQALCYNETTTIACGDTSFPRQDADYVDVSVGRSYTGPTAHASFTADYTTTDNVRNLVWKSCTEGLSGATCGSGTATVFDWYNAINACAGLNTANAGAGYAGRTNWRLPTERELSTLPNYTFSNPAIEVDNFPGTQSGFYWSSTTYVSNANNAWHVVSSGNINSMAGDLTPYKTNLYDSYVRCLSD